MRLLIAALVSFVVSAIAGKILIPVLRRMKAGQSIKEDGPTWHMSKQGTPTMGGLMFILGILCTLLQMCIRDSLQSDAVWCGEKSCGDHYTGFAGALQWIIPAAGKNGLHRHHIWGRKDLVIQ